MVTGHAVFADGDTLGGPAALSEAVFAGTCIVYSRLPSVAALSARVRELVTAGFGEEPQQAEQRLSAEEFRQQVAQTRKRVANDAEALVHWRGILSEVGYDLDEVQSDRMRLRIAPSGANRQSRFARTIPAHRDSWGSGIACQINWWTPLFELTGTRTMLIWPEAFDRPIANTAADWDYDTLLSRTVPDYPQLPEATEPPPGPPVPVLISPGEILAFSAAHLHAGISDNSGLTRFSLDTRSLWDGDIHQGRGAPDVDGNGKPPRWDMFGRTPDVPAHSPHKRDLQ